VLLVFLDKVCRRVEGKPDELLERKVFTVAQHVLELGEGQLQDVGSHLGQPQRAGRTGKACAGTRRAC